MTRHHSEIPSSGIRSGGCHTTPRKRDDMSNAVPPRGHSHPARRFPRYPLDIKLSVHVFREGKTVAFWGRSTEFAEDGLSATLTGEAEAGEVVSMELSLPHVAF